MNEFVIDEIKRQDLKRYLEDTENLHFNGNGQCLCPFHDDHHPSFHVSEKEDGIWKWYCHACSIGGSNIDFIMRKYSLEFLEAVKRLAKHYGLEERMQKNSKVAEGEIIRKHDYLDESGNFVWQKIRLRDGTFRCRRKNGDKWLYSLDGIKPIPYRLNEIKDKTTVYLCEGEKDADTLTALGYAATTAPFGKGSWPDELNSYFTDKEVPIIFDVGNEQDAHKVAEKLSKTAKKVYILSVPLDEIEADITDYLDRFSNDENKISKLLDLPGQEYDLKSQQELYQDDSGSLSKRISRYVDDSSGWFDNVRLYNQLGINTREEKNNAYVILHRLKTKKIIEPHSTMNGRYRKVDKQFNKIDWKNAPTTPVAITLPLDLNNLVSVYPKSIIVIAGVTGTGKTTLGLNTAKDNRDKFNVHYWTSELGRSQLKIRLSSFEDMTEGEWDKVNFYDRSDNFADCIAEFPNDIHIIDYLELESDFFEAGGLIKDIFKKLNDGIVIICLQKKPGSDYGYGGILTASKADLYLSLDIGMAKIVKSRGEAKPGINPKNQVVYFKIIQDGSKLVPQGEWHNFGDDPHDEEV